MCIDYTKEKKNGIYIYVLALVICIIEVGSICIILW